MAIDALGLLPNSWGRCRKCGAQLGSTQRSQMNAGYCRFPMGIALTCSDCDDGLVYQNVLAGSIWAGQRIEKFLPFILFYLNSYPMAGLGRELRLAPVTARTMRIQIQEIMAAHLLSGQHIAGLPIGGHNVIVQVDETMLNRGKPRAAPFQLARHAAGFTPLWLWGATTEGGMTCGEVSFVLLRSLDKPRGVAALRKALLATVRPGSIIVHDDWGAYRAMDWASLGYSHSARCVVNHAKDIKNVFGNDTNHIECVWSCLKRWLRKQAGGKIPAGVSLQLYVWEFLWRQRTKAEGHVPAFVRFINNVTDIPGFFQRPKHWNVRPRKVQQRHATFPQPLPLEQHGRKVDVQETDFGSSGEPVEEDDNDDSLAAPLYSDDDDVPLPCAADKHDERADLAAALLPEKRPRSTSPTASRTSCAASEGSTAPRPRRRAAGPRRRFAPIENERAFYIRRIQHLDVYGYTDGCKACEVALANGRPQGYRHSPICRQRIAECIAASAGETAPAPGLTMQEQGAIRGGSVGMAAKISRKTSEYALQSIMAGMFFNEQRIAVARKPWCLLDNTYDCEQTRGRGNLQMAPMVAIRTLLTHRSGDS